MSNEISKSDMKMLIKTGNIGFSLPVHADNILWIKKYEDIEEIVASEFDDISHSIFFTYWNWNKRQPLFDIEVFGETDDLTTVLSEYTIFGMYIPQNKRLNIGIKNNIDFHNINVPDTDLVKYVKNNFNKVMIEKDFV